MGAERSRLRSPYGQVRRPLEDATLDTDAVEQHIPTAVSITLEERAPSAVSAASPRRNALHPPARSDAAIAAADGRRNSSNTSERGASSNNRVSIPMSVACRRSRYRASPGGPPAPLGRSGARWRGGVSSASGDRRPTSSGEHRYRPT